MTSQNNGVHISNSVLQYPVIPTGILTVTTKKRTLGLCLGWKGQGISCVTRGREGGEGRGGEGRVGEGRGGREGGKERGGRGGREGRDDCYTYYSDGSTIFI